MTEKNNATCSICGRGYYMCVSCKDMITLNPWKKHTDTSEHYKIYQVLHGFNTGVYTKEEAKSKLQMIDLSDLDTLRSHIKDLIKDIMKDEENINIEVSVQKESEPASVKGVKAARKGKSVNIVETDDYTVPTE